MQGNTIVGEVCHIAAASPNGPRYDPRQTATERHSYTNLILMCANHHAVIDDDPESFTVERLRRMKADHEAHGAALDSVQINRGVRLIVDRSVATTNQTGGIAAHTVHQTIHIHSPTVLPVQGPDRQSIIARIREFRDDRVTKIAAGDGAVDSLDGGTLVLHIVPFSAIGTQRNPAFDDISRNPNAFPPIGNGIARGTKVTFDGLLTGSNADGLTNPQRAYCHVFRSGALEAVVSSLARGRQHDFLMLPQIQAMIIKYAFTYSLSLSKLGVEAPFAVLASLVDVQGKRLLQDFIENALPEDIPSGPFDKDRYDFVDVILEAAPTDYGTCATQLLPLLNHIANVADLVSSPYFDTHGNYTLKL